ncbi:MAG: LOG family protein [Pseudonocardia sp.]|nr:LOG family protein [Pseudonocardia sp.]
MEIHDVDALAAWLAGGTSPAGLRLQNLDLTAVEPDLVARTDLDGLVVLGGRISAPLRTHLIAHGAVVFPAVPDAPVEVYRATLYTADELYAGLDAGYAATADARAYAWSRDTRLVHDAYATLLRAVHDDAVTDALDEWIAGAPVVGVMGGHAADRGTPAYAAAARLGRGLAEAGFVVATGGGPGAMEAANLGASAPSDAALDEALARLAAVVSFRPGIRAWARLAFAVRAGFPEADRPRSLGIPTWFYGHEPPNVFADGIAKYFSNALREDGLLARSTAGVVVTPGAAGTVQEIFQLGTRLYYTGPGEPLPPLVLLGRDHWTRTLPVVPLLEALGCDRAMARAVHVVDSVAEAIAVVAERAVGYAGRARARPDRGLVPPAKGRD